MTTAQGSLAGLNALDLSFILARGAAGSVLAELALRGTI